MRVLVTNDDGIHAPGLHALAGALAEAGHDVLMATSLTDQSGASSALGNGYGTGVAVEQVDVEGLTGIPAFGIDGPPALAVMAARLGAFGEPPDFVVSGVNPGNNTGRAVLHSGTVGAALTAANFGISGLAVSQATGDPWLVETSAAIGAKSFEWLIGAPRSTVLNVNVPNLPLERLQGVRLARLAPFGTVRSVLADRSESKFQIELRATEEKLADDTDTMLVLAGYVAVTPLVGVRAAPDDSGAVAALEAALSVP